MARTLTWEGLRKRHRGEEVTLLRLSRRIQDPSLWLALAERRKGSGDAEGEVRARFYASQCGRFEPGYYVHLHKLLPNDWHIEECFEGELIQLTQGRGKVLISGEMLMDGLSRPLTESVFGLEGASDYVASQSQLASVFHTLGVCGASESQGTRPGSVRRWLPWKHCKVELWDGHYSLAW